MIGASREFQTPSTRARAWPTPLHDEAACQSGSASWQELQPTPHDADCNSTHPNSSKRGCCIDKLEFVPEYASQPDSQSIPAPQSSFPRSHVAYRPPRTVSQKTLIPENYAGSLATNLKTRPAFNFKASLEFLDRTPKIPGQIHQ